VGAILLAAIFLYSIFAPDSEINDEQYNRINQERETVSSKELYTFYELISEDGKIMNSEFNAFINRSLEVQFKSTSE
jgi:tagatose-1,6-bisphosphate aldolase